MWDTWSIGSKDECPTKCTSLCNRERKIHDYFVTFSYLFGGDEYVIQTIKSDMVRMY